MPRPGPSTAADIDASALPAPVDDVASADIGDLRWDLLLLCVAGYIMCAVGRVHQLFAALEPLRPAVMTGLLAIVVYMLDPREERRLSHVLGPTTTLLLAFLVWIALSVPGALRPGASFDLLVDNFAKTVLMYFVVAGCARGIRDVERLAAVYFLAAVVYTIVVLTRFELGAGDAWRLGRLYDYDANDYATFAVTAMPFGLYFLHAGRRPLARLLAAAGLALLTLGFVRAGSRGGFMALAAVAGFILLRYSAIPLRWRVSATVLIAVLLAATASDQYWQQMGTILSERDYNRTNESGRLQIWGRGVEYMLQNPVFGVGANNFPAAEGTLSPFAERQQFGIGVRWNAPHNTFVQVGAELGIPGLVLFVAIIASAFVVLHRSTEHERGLVESVESHVQITPALTASLIGFVVGSFFLSLAYTEMLYTLVALSVGLQKVTAEYGSRE